MKNSNKIVMIGFNTSWTKLTLPPLLPFNLYLLEKS